MVFWGFRWTDGWWSRRESNSGSITPDKATGIDHHAFDTNMNTNKNGIRRPFSLGGTRKPQIASYDPRMYRTIHRKALRNFMANALPETGYLRLYQIIGDPRRIPAVPPLVPISKSAWWAGVRSGRFPRSIKLGPRTTVWRVEDIRAILSIAGSD